MACLLEIIAGSLRCRGPKIAVDGQCPAIPLQQIRSASLRAIAYLVAAMLLSGTPAVAQTPAASPVLAQPAPQAAQPSAPAPAATPESYSYDPAGRRDPFMNLVGTGSDSRATGLRRGDGPAGMAVADISVRGVLVSRGVFVAMILGPDNKTYLVHQGDKLLDGAIKSITPQGLVIIQEVNDPLSLVKQREVSKLLRSLEVVKP